MICEEKHPGDNSPCDRCHNVDGISNKDPAPNNFSHGGRTSAVGKNPGSGLSCEYVVRVTVGHGPCAATLSPPVDTYKNNEPNNPAPLAAASEDPS